VRNVVPYHGFLSCKLTNTCHCILCLGYLKVGGKLRHFIPIIQSFGQEFLYEGHLAQ
jgi:hypothetical protein